MCSRKKSPLQQSEGKVIKRTKGRAELGLDGVIAGQVVGSAKILVEAAGEVHLRARQVAASLAGEERMTLQQSSEARLIT